MVSKLSVVESIEADDIADDSHRESKSAEPENEKRPPNRGFQA